MPICRLKRVLAALALTLNLTIADYCRLSILNFDSIKFFAVILTYLSVFLQMGLNLGQIVR